MQLNRLLQSVINAAQGEFPQGVVSPPRRIPPPGEAPVVFEHLRALQGLADQYGDRAAGTRGYEAAAQYVEQQLAEAGLRSTRQHFSFKDGGRTIETFSVLAETEAGRGDHVVMIGGHLDGVPGAPAINDNGSGVAAVLEAAKALSGRPDLVNKVRFAFWGAEEFSKSYGSRHYVKDLAKNNKEELRRIAAYLNFDMIASPNPIFAVYDARDSDADNDVTPGSTQIMDLFTGYFDSLNLPWTTTDWDYDSDQVAFVKRGVAAGGLYTGDDEKKSNKEARLFGGAAKRACDPNYHSAGDDIRNVDISTLRLMTEAILDVVTRLAGDPYIR
jgi:Zn-dependent M28 family amino/carboxypeptidase